MTIENFLSFWSHHNIAIIEGLIALVILLSLFTAYRSFFSKAAKAESIEGAGHGFDTTQIEKALQKILDNQAENQTHASQAKAQAGEDLSTDMDLSAMESDPSGGKSVEVQELRSSLNQSEKKVETLQKQLEEALTKASELAEAAATPSSPAATESAKEAESFQAKINDLETRLAEYEIISEDIADLSRYREENEQLKKEIETLKVGSALSTDSAPAPVPAPESEPASSDTSEIAAEPAADLLSELDAALQQAGQDTTVNDAFIDEALASQTAAATEAPTAPPVESASADLIDDELMKEFAAAVEGQKAAGKVGEKAGDGTTPPAKTGADTDELMEEFENFVSKKG